MKVIKIIISIEIIIIIIICKDILNPGRTVIILILVNPIQILLMASFDSPDNNSILDDSTPLPAIINHEIPLRLNVPIEHNYARVDGVFIDTSSCNNLWKEL